MKVAVDAMGGDFGPKVTVAGALKASREYKIEALLVGIEDLIKKEYDRLDHSQAKITIVNAAEAIGMGEGILSFRRKKRSSIRIGAELVKDGEAEAFVSTGNTAAVVYLSKKILGALKGVEKPALSLLVPNLKSLTLLIDVGANVNCRPHHLQQFAVMGHIFMESVLGLKNPRIGLMSIGEEESKGNELTKEAFDRLQASPLNFIGNVALKVSEGVVETFFYMARTELMKNFFSKIGLFLMKRNLKKIYKKIDYAEYGGAQLLGINGVCIIGHGRSNPNAVKNAVGLAKDFVQNKVQEKIQNGIANISYSIGKAEV
jgi:glycerol-3-phosphate acyltransferase PlsX